MVMLPRVSCRRLNMEVIHVESIERVVPPVLIRVRLVQRLALLTGAPSSHVKRRW